jgi:hypothetical protein
MRRRDDLWDDPWLIPGEARRLRTWELSPLFQSSIIAICLTANELRHILVKGGDIDAQTVSEHALHGRGVRLAGQRDGAGVLLNRELDRRHAASIKLLSKAIDVSELRRLWLSACERGELPSAYWAVLSSPLSDFSFVREVFSRAHLFAVDPATRPFPIATAR